MPRSVGATRLFGMVIVVAVALCASMPGCQSQGKPGSGTSSTAAPVDAPSEGFVEPKPGPPSESVSAYFVAASKGRWNAVNRSLKAGVDIDAKDLRGQTALHLAAANGHDDLIGRLISGGADIDAQDSAGNTPLHVAVLNGQGNCIRVLRSRGADPTIRNKAGLAVSPGAPRIEQDEPETESQGTGFFVSRLGHVVTCHHVVEGAQTITVIDAEGREIPARVLRASPNDDLAVLQTDTASSALCVDTSDRGARGLEVVVLGFPLPGMQGRDLKATFGRINGLTGLQGDPRHYQIDAAIQPGNSGGPLLDFRGNVIGVVSHRLSALAVLRETGQLPQNVNYAIKASRLATLFDGVPVTGPCPSAELSSQAVVAGSEAAIVRVIAK